MNNDFFSVLNPLKWNGVQIYLFTIMQPDIHTYSLLFVGNR